MDLNISRPLIGLVFVFVAAAQESRPWSDYSKLAQQRETSADFPGAEQLWRAALRSAELTLGRDNEQVAIILIHLGGALHREGRDQEADPIYRRALVTAQASGHSHLLASVLNGLGLALAGQGELARAEPVLRRSLALFEESVGPDTLDTAKAENNLASIYSDTLQFAKAEPLMRRALPIYEKYLGPEDPALAGALANMFTLLSNQHRAEEGEPYLRRALAIGEKRFPGTDAMAHLQVCLSGLEFLRGQYEEAAQTLRDAIALQERTLGPNHPEVARSLGYYSSVMRRLHNRTEAKEAQNRANSILKRTILN